MSIQTEIDRLNGAKAGIKASIENGGFSVPASSKLDDYPDILTGAFTKLNNALSSIRTAIIQKGVDVPENTDVSDYASKISDIIVHTGAVVKTYILDCPSSGSASQISLGEYGNISLASASSGTMKYFCEVIIPENNDAGFLKILGVQHTGGSSSNDIKTTTLKISFDSSLAIPSNVSNFYNYGTSFGEVGFFAKTIDSASKYYEFTLNYKENSYNYYEIFVPFSIS